MFHRKEANDLIRAMWEQDKALPVAEVAQALRDKGMGRRTKTVAEAITNFLGPSGQPSQDAEAFPEKSGTIEAALPEPDAPRKPPKRREAVRKLVQAAAPETGNGLSTSEFARAAQQALEMANRLALLEERLHAWETENARLKAELAQTAKEAQKTTDALAHLEERLRVLETDDDRMLNRVLDTHRQRREMFPERVRNAVSEILHVRDSLTTHDIMEMIPPALYREAERLRQPLNLRTLAEKLGVDLSQDGRRDSAVNE